MQIVKQNEIIATLIITTAALTIDPIKNEQNWHPRLMTRMKYETISCYRFANKNAHSFNLILIFLLNPNQCKHKIISIILIVNYLIKNIHN